MARFSTFIHEMAMCRSFIYKMASAKVFHGILAQLPFIVFKMARVTSFRTTLWPLYSWKVTNGSPAEPSLDHQRRLAVSEPIGGWRLSRAIRRLFVNETITMTRLLRLLRRARPFVVTFPMTHTAHHLSRCRFSCGPNSFDSWSASAPVEPKEEQSGLERFETCQRG